MRGVGERFHFVHIHRGLAGTPGLQRIHQRIGGDQSGAAGVHQQPGGLHHLQVGLGDDATRAVHPRPRKNNPNRPSPTINRQLVEKKVNRTRQSVIRIPRHDP